MKRIESVSFYIQESSTLNNLSSDLVVLVAKYAASVCSEKGLAICRKATYSAVN